MRYQHIKEILSKLNPQAVVLEGFDQAIIGYTQNFPPFCAVYDIEKCIAIMVENGMSVEDAVEYFDSNFLIHSGENNPIFISNCIFFFTLK